MESACFSHPDVLKAVSIKWLVRLLEPHAAFLESRGLTLPGPNASWDDLDDRKLVSILTGSDPEVPKDLTDPFYYLHEMATPEAMDRLLEDAEAEGIVVDDDPDPTPQDIAVQIWLQNSDLLKHRHAERSVSKPYDFVYFQGAEKSGSGIWTPDTSILKALEVDLAEWFHKRKRGPYCQVQFYTRDESMHFVIGHGQPAKREGCVCGDGTALYHPKQHDLIVFRPGTGELKVHASTSAVARAYKKLLGRHLFGSDDHFCPASKYTLDPLKTDGEKALVCSDVDGVNYVRLTTLRLLFSGPSKDCETRAAEDVFAVMRSHHETIPDEAQIAEAGFEMDFADSGCSRSVWVQPSDSDGYECESDCERAGRWFKNRGFALFCQLLMMPLAQRLWQLLQGLEWTVLSSLV